MKNFHINEQLARDCHQLAVVYDCHILLMNNSLVPWIIIVPEIEETEFFEIEDSQQQKILKLINQLSKFIKQEYKVDKLNVATIGNVVKQMHIHIVGRNNNDYCWPGVVWGADGCQPYIEEEVLTLKENLQAYINNQQ